MGVLRALLSIGNPKAKPRTQWHEIEAAKNKVSELERRLHFSEQSRYRLRSPLLASARAASLAREDTGR